MILSNPFSQKEFIDFIKGFLPEFKLDLRKVEVGSSGFSEVLRLGESSPLMTSVLIVRSTKSVNSRISLTNNSFKILKTHNIYRALIVYVNDDDSIWRLSLLTALPTFDGTGKVVISYSNPRRHSYVLGSEVGIATARKYLSSMGPITGFEDLQYRFSVEAVNKDFYREIAQHFYQLVGSYSETGEVVHKPLLKLSASEATLADLQKYSVRLLGRLLFIWFLKQKKSVDGISLLPFNLVQPDKLKNYLHAYLEPLFFEVLNKNITKREEKFAAGDYKLVPYLNGGLFHPSDGASGDYYSTQYMKSSVEVPDSWFEELFNTLNTYNFTIDENLENEIDLSIDPEMLGRIFENLLAEINPETGQVARKSTGSYYTPRSIVNYMVDASLLDFLSAKTQIDDTKLKALMSTSKLDDLEHPMSDNECSLVISAISKLKCLDPACGSGAFPMGLLQKLLWVVSQADPTGELFLDSQDFDGTEHWLTESKLEYLRKRKLIRDTIFGVDIQSIAVEIAKLRCFLTLIVDQEINDLLPNRGVIPLPNLDFKFICADSLTTLDNDARIMFGEDPDLESKLSDIRKRYFTTTSEDRKLKLANEYEKYISAPDSLFSESKRQAQLKTFKPFSQNTQAEYFDQQSMLGINSFDIVIGNPPYVSHDKVTIPKNELRKYEVFEGFADLYCYFIEMAVRASNAAQGRVCFIVSNSFIKSQYGEPLRKYLTSNKLLDKLINVEESQLFQSVIVNTAILLTSHSEKDFTQILNTTFSDDSISFQQFVDENLTSIESDRFGEKPWVLSAGPAAEIYAIVNKSGPTLEKHGAVLRLGIATGFNEAYVISSEYRDQLIALDKKNADLIKPVLGGEDIDRYFYRSSKFLILAKNGINIEKDYPTLVPHFSSFGKKFRERGAQGKTWLNLRACAFFESFKEEKVVWIELANNGRFAYSNEEVYLLNSAIFLTPPATLSAKSLVAILNSKLINFYMTQISQTSGMGTKRWIKATVKDFPIPERQTSNSEIFDKLDSLCEDRLALGPVANSEKGLKLEELIDATVDELYGIPGELARQYK